MLVKEAKGVKNMDVLSTMYLIQPEHCSNVELKCTATLIWIYYAEHSNYSANSKEDFQNLEMYSAT